MRISQKCIENDINVLSKQGIDDLEIITTLSKKYNIRRCDIWEVVFCCNLGRRKTDNSEGWGKRGYYGYFERTANKI